MIPPKILPIIRQTHVQGNHASYEIEPLEEGYGMTLGNALRRILLSSLPGTAIVSIQIQGALHEFQDIPHVLEDLTDIVLNIKQLRLRGQINESVSLHLEGRGEGIVTAAQILTPNTVEIVNPELYIATLDNPQAFLVMKLIAETGIGFVPAEANHKLPLGIIPIDAIFTPIRKVNYRVEHTRIGQTTNYDKVVLDIWTDGTITPLKALRESSLILAGHFTRIAQYQFPSQQKNAALPTSLPIPSKIHLMPIEMLEMSPRTYLSLKQANISRVGQILEMEQGELLAMKNFGEKSLRELYERLQFCNCLPEVLNTSGKFAPP